MGSAVGISPEVGLSVVFAFADVCCGVVALHRSP